MPYLDVKARRLAKRAGLRAIKSRRLLGTVDNFGGFQLIDGHSNRIVAGVRLDLSAEQVIAWCSGDEAPE